jgi:uncharacterized protein YbjT (DUF2867 family)
MPSEAVVVVNATGRQGRAVVTALIESCEWTVYATTRDTGSPDAEALRAAGASLVQAGQTVVPPRRRLCSSDTTTST